MHWSVTNALAQSHSKTVMHSNWFLHALHTHVYILELKQYLLPKWDVCVFLQDLPLCRVGEVPIVGEVKWLWTIQHSHESIEQALLKLLPNLLGLGSSWELTKEKQTQDVYNTIAKGLGGWLGRSPMLIFLVHTFKKKLSIHMFWQLSAMQNIWMNCPVWT